MSGIWQNTANLAILLEFWLGQRKILPMWTNML